LLPFFCIGFLMQTPVFFAFFGRSFSPALLSYFFPRPVQYWMCNIPRCALAFIPSPFFLFLIRFPPFLIFYLSTPFVDGSHPFPPLFFLRFTSLPVPWLFHKTAPPLHDLFARRVPRYHKLFSRTIDSRTFFSPLPPPRMLFPSFPIT